MDIKTSKTTAIHLHSPFRMSEAGFFHFILFGFSIGKDGIGVYFMGFLVGYGWNE